MVPAMFDAAQSSTEKRLERDGWGAGERDRERGRGRASLVDSPKYQMEKLWPKSKEKRATAAK